jgi:hypothetical protein
VWIYVTGTPPRRKDDLLALWSIGSLFRKTLKIDMPFTRERVLRNRIGCIDPERIPDKMSIYVGDGFYELKFEVEVDNEEDPMLEDNTVKNQSNLDDDQGGNDNDHGNKSAKNQNIDASQGTGSSAPNGSTSTNPIAAPSSGADGYQKKVGVSFSPKLQREIVKAKRYLSNLYAPKSAVQTLSKVVGEGAPTEFHVAKVAGQRIQIVSLLR